MKVSSGLGESRPMNIVVLPILFEGEVKGVMELASLDRFNPTHQAFLDQLAEGIGIVLHTIEANTGRKRCSNNRSRSPAGRIAADECGAGRKGPLKSGQGSIPRHAQPRVAYSTDTGARIRARTGKPADLFRKMRESVQIIRRNVELEARLIDDLLDLTRISTGKVQLNFEVVDAHTLLRNALEICQADIEQKQLKLQLDLTAQKIHLRADPARVQQILWNLIKNAVKFTARDGEISIATSNDADGQLRVQVTDSGIGIEPEALPKIFDAFEQGGRTKLGGLV